VFLYLNDVKGGGEDEIDESTDPLKESARVMTELKGRSSPSESFKSAQNFTDEDLQSSPEVQHLTNTMTIGSRPGTNVGC
jgi:hypothetical protein